MKKIMKSFSVRKIVLTIACLCSLILFIVLSLISSAIIRKQDTQQAALRWSDEGDVSQISCFFSVNAYVTEDFLEEFSHKVDAALQESSVEIQSENPGARLWVDAFSANGTISIKGSIGSITSDAIGIGGDFFLFHPIQLVSGSYFSGNDLMQDYCVLDELAAWKLFGSNNIAGQVVEIGGVSHIVTGVVKHKTGKLQEEAGLEDMLVYVSYDSLQKYGMNNGINHYEILMPNPVKEYAYNYVKDNIGISEKEVEIVENSNRYSVWSRVKQIGKLPTRAMNGKAIIYPYWENVARANEDILAFIMLGELIFLGFPSIVVLIILIRLWKKKTWTVKSVLIKCKDKLLSAWDFVRNKMKSKRKRPKKNKKHEWVDIKEYEEE